MSNRRKPGTAASVDGSLSAWTRRRLVSWTLIGLAIVVAVQHLIAHSGWQPLPMGMGMQDIFLGYPMAALLALAGLMWLDPRPPI